jgi:thiamine kinase-like enzyme
VETPDGAVVLIDWECSGWGVTVLDLGRLLLECHLDQDQPASGHIQPDAERIAAVVTGYRAYHLPSAAELAFLLEAMRFGVAFDAARHFAQAMEEGWTAAVERRLARRANRYMVSATIADLAYAYFLPAG